MSDDNSMLGMSRKGRLTADITYLMLKGAGYAALLVLGLWLVIAIISAVGQSLPERSRDTQDPTPMSFLSVPMDQETTQV